MAKKRTTGKPAKRKTDAAILVYCQAAERKRFDRVAELEGFQNRSAWILYHLRQIAKDALKRESE